MTRNYSRREMLQQSSAAVTGLTTFSTSSFADSGVETGTEDTVDDHAIPYDLSLHNNGTQDHEISIRIGKNEFADVAIAESYALRGLNTSGDVEPDETIFKTELPNSGDGLYQVEATLKGGQSASGQIRLNGGVQDESAIVVRVYPSNTVTLETIIE